MHFEAPSKFRKVGRLQSNEFSVGKDMRPLDFMNQFNKHIKIKFIRI